MNDFSKRYATAQSCFVYRCDESGNLLIYYVELLSYKELLSYHRTNRSECLS
jgi:hypothetical protein